MAKHEFHMPDECPVHSAWLRGEETKPCNMIYVGLLLGNLPSSRNARTHCRANRWRSNGPYVWFYNGDLVRLDNKSNLESVL